ncbi:ABC transporter substrate-binding protein [Nocardiopsis sp. RSe5-2]|uniref:ABC transporter substrate-binding protein n=1 Tax=Nocardiopsis endophytica TaxID=3018445 RepID=A0ABT4TWN9_9ACTN|nr:ABC transporter substrate-binding protein [Nocardiopsis endophytica]MDA2809117.1 ABC transporter substrate-binding protein [Nocardiopsis endophytica]
MASRARALPAALAAVVLAAAACTSESDGGGGYPRAQTLYTSGTQWGPPSTWNPLAKSQYATGTVGYVYEPLFLYDPMEDEYRPWLAEEGEWTGEDTYSLTIRDGIEWSDGEAFTAEDVAYTVELGRIDAVPYSNLWDWLEGVEVVNERELEFTFSEPRRQEWANWLYNEAIVPEHVWSGRSEDEVVNDPNEDPVGTGPYAYETHGQDRMVWAKRDDWWATEQLDLDVRPEYIVDIVNSTNDAALTMLTQGEIDLSNNFLPGIDRTLEASPEITSYYDEPPYMLSANTTWLVPNTEREPMDDPEFRRALAHAVDPQAIADGPYGGIVAPADPTGLLPAWEQYVDQDLVEEEGFSHDPEEARSILEEAGYTENADGMFATPDGDPVALELIVPSGWTDWMEAADIVAESAAEAGIDITVEFPDDAALQDARATGDFDLLFNNERQISNTPWTYYDYMFRLPVQEQQTTVNFGRYENEEAWELTEELARVDVEDTERIAELTSQLQEIHFAETPVIPLWYNGLWSQVNESVWTNWPSDASDTPPWFPTTWRNYNQMGAVLTLTEIEPVSG